MHMSADRIREKLRVHRSHPMVLAYVCACFSASKDASLLSVYKISIPPDFMIRKPKGNFVSRSHTAILLETKGVALPSPCQRKQSQ